MGMSFATFGKAAEKAAAGLDKLAMSADSAATALADVAPAAQGAGEALKSAADPFAKFVEAAKEAPLALEYLRPTLEKIQQDFAKGTININQARAALQSLLSQLSEWSMADRRWGDAGAINDLWQQVEKLLNELQRHKP